MTLNDRRLKGLQRDLEDKKRSLDRYNRRKTALLTMTSGFFALMVVCVGAGFIIPLGNGAIGISLTSIAFFCVSAFFTGLWIFEGWEAGYEKEYEEARVQYERYLIDDE